MTFISAWIDPETIFNSVIILYENCLLVSNPTEKKATAIKARIDAGTPPPQTELEQDATVIPLADIKWIDADKHDEYIEIRFQGKKGRYHKTIGFAGSAIRDQAFDTLRQKLSPDFEFSTVQHGRLRTSIAPVSIMAFLVILTGLFYRAAHAIVAGGEPSNKGLLKLILLYVVKVLGPTGVLVVWWPVDRNLFLVVARKNQEPTIHYESQTQKSINLLRKRKGVRSCVLPLCVNAVICLIGKRQDLTL